MSFALKNFKHLRRVKGFTQKELASVMNIHRSTIGAIEEERVRISLDFAAAFCKIVNIKIDDFYHYDFAEATTPLKPTETVHSIEAIERAFKKLFPHYYEGWKYLKSML